MPYPLEFLFDDVAQIQHSAVDVDVFGSGRLIGSNLVLTARHVVRPEGIPIPDEQGWKVRLLAGRPRSPETENWPWTEASVIWVGREKLDLALLQLRAPSEFSPKMKLRISRIDELEPHPARGLGFPRGAKVDDRRTLFAPSGNLDDTEDATLRFGINQADLPDNPRDDWRGFSGAAIVLPESTDTEVVWIYGVAQQVPQSFSRQLAVARLAKAWEDPEFRACLEAANITVEPPSDPVVRQRNIRQPANRLIAIHQLPPAPRDFTGRAMELSELMTAVEKGGVTILAIQGLGGIGKTALALVLAERLRERYPDAQFYVDLKGAGPDPLISAEAMARVIRAYYPETEPPTNDAQLCADYRSVLHGKAAILLMDNARDAVQVAPLIPPTECLLLITSRCHLALPGLYAKTLDMLNSQDAEKLLLAATPRIEGLASEIAHMCGYLPLALRAAASSLAETPNLRPADYLARLADARKRLELKDPTQDSSVNASLSLSYGLLSAELQHRFDVLSVFPEMFDATGAAAVWGIAVDAAQESLETLVRYSMVIFNPERDRYGLHDLVGDFADSHLSEEQRREAGLNHAEYYLKTINLADLLYSSGGESVAKGLALFDLEWRNIEAGQSWATVHASSEDETASRLCWGYSVASVLFLRLKPSKRIEWLKSALAASLHLGDRERQIALARLGSAYFELEDYEYAFSFHEESLNHAKASQDREAEEDALESLAFDCSRMDKSQQARTLARRSLAIAKKSKDAERQCSALNMLGIVYADSEDYPRAIEFYKRADRLRDEVGYSGKVGPALCNLALIYRGVDDVSHAIECYEKALKIAITISDRRRQAICYGNLAYIYRQNGDYHRALELEDKALEIAREMGDRWGEATTLRYRALVLHDSGDLEAAFADAKAALAIFEDRGDPDANEVRDTLAAWESQRHIAAV